MDSRMKNDLDNWITGHYGEDQFRGESEMLPAGTEVICPVCDDEFVIKEVMVEYNQVECPHCSAQLILVDEELEEVSYSDEEDELDGGVDGEEEEEEEEDEVFPDEDKEDVDDGIIDNEKIIDEKK